MATSRRGKSKPPDHSERVRTGLTKAKERGVKLGRPAEQATSQVRLLPTRMGARWAATSDLQRRRPALPRLAPRLGRPGWPRNGSPQEPAFLHRQPWLMLAICRTAVSFVTDHARLVAWQDRCAAAREEALHTVVTPPRGGGSVPSTAWMGPAGCA